MEIGATLHFEKLDAVVGSKWKKLIGNSERVTS